MPDSLIQQCQESGNFMPFLEQVPYAAHIGMTLISKGDDIQFCLPARESNLGNPALPALHGGVIAGFMEHSAIISLLRNLGEVKIPKTIDFSIDYLRTGKHQETFADCIITRQGRRVANVQINCWQDKKENVIATARAHFLLSGPSEKS